MKRTNGNRALLRAVALGQILLLVVAGCKSTSDKGSKAVVVNQALVGKDGAVTVTDPNMIVNDYAALATNAAVNDPSVTVASGGLSGLAAGDLVLIIQMAGATINEPNDASYGNVTDLGSAGNYELVGVTGFSANTITLGSNLHNSYTVAGKTQVVRVPQYSTLTINDGASIIAPPWNGTVGGVVALQAATTLDLSTSGKIDASATGFRGGATHTGLNFTTDSDQPSYRSVDPNEGAEKGESIAGDPNTLAFPYGRGAPANGGGGGNWHNAGGGGGANAAATGVGSDAAGPAWTGEGVMLNSVLGAAAWSLDPGYALKRRFRRRWPWRLHLLGPNHRIPRPWAATDATWGREPPTRARRSGRASAHEQPRLAQDFSWAAAVARATATTFSGGNPSGPGGRGGGLVFVIAGTVTGSGSILANGGRRGRLPTRTVLFRATARAAAAAGVGGGHAGALGRSSKSGRMEERAATRSASTATLRPKVLAVAAAAATSPCPAVRRQRSRPTVAWAARPAHQPALRALERIPLQWRHRGPGRPHRRHGCLLHALLHQPDRDNGNQAHRSHECGRRDVLLHQRPERGHF